MPGKGRLEVIDRLFFEMVGHRSSMWSQVIGYVLRDASRMAATASGAAV
jgi:hypothetical protein